MIEPSTFDSETFGLRVGKASLSGLTPAALSAIRAAAAGAFDVVFIRDLDPRFRDLHTLDWNGLELADVKARLTRALRGSALPAARPAQDTFVVEEEARPEEATALEAIVERIADRSRFVEAFGREAARRLYRRWLENSLAGTAADACFVARARASREPAGLVTVRYLAPAAELVLVATSARHEGQGVGRLLTAHVLSALAKRGFEECRVGTQWTNRAALRFYGSEGFEFDSTMADYHLRPLAPTSSRGPAA